MTSANKQNKIREQELFFSFSHAGGPGGQNVNKVATKVTLKWKVAESAAFSDKEKDQLRGFLHNKINNQGQVVIQVDSERSQNQNKAEAVKRLNDLVEEALEPVKERKATNPTKGSIEKRLQSKKVRAAVKKSRGPVGELEEE